MYNILQQREAFHLVFLRHFIGRVKPNTYALKGGSNLRFFYKSVRYSEDMGVDVREIEVFKLRDLVMDILSSKTVGVAMRTYNIAAIKPPDIAAMKQTETVQRFKIHLSTPGGEDIFTKIEFSRRGMKGKSKTEVVDTAVLQRYGLPPLYICHYSADMAIVQKISALADRKKPQARDVFDIFTVISRTGDTSSAIEKLPQNILKAAEETLFRISYEQYVDTVTSYLSEEDRGIYQNREMWERMQLAVAEML